MAKNPITVNLPADLPENWNDTNYVSPEGTEAGLTSKHGYNYLMKQVNKSQQAAQEIGDAFEQLASFDPITGEITRDRLPDATSNDSGIVQLNDTISSTSATQAATARAVNEVASASLKSYLAGGTATSLALTIPFVTQYDDGRIYNFVTRLSNGGAATTLNINDQGAKSVYKDGSASPPELEANNGYRIRYNASNNCFYVESGGGGGTAVWG